MEADSDHSIIERVWRRQTNLKIMIPWDWQQLVCMASAARTFEVIPIERTDFKNYKCLYEGSKSPFVMHKKSCTGQAFLISQLVCFQAHRDGILCYKTKFENDFDKIVLKRNKRQPVVFPKELPVIPVKVISSQKYKHLQNLLKWVPTIFHPFYKNIPHAATASV